MEGDGLPIAHCSGAMLVQTVEEALLVQQSGGAGATTTTAKEGEQESNSSSSSAFASVPFVSKPNEKLPRLALLSGMTSAEAVAIASYWEQFASSKAPVVAALRPRMVSRKLGDLILEATLASASAASASADENAESVSKRSVIDAESIREKVRASVEARRATRAAGPIQLVIPPRDGRDAAVSASAASGSPASASSSSPPASAAAPRAAAAAAAAGSGPGKAAAVAAAERRRVAPPAPEKVRARGFGNSSNNNNPSKN